MMARPHLHVDWDEAVALATKAAGEWVLVASDVPARTVETVRNRENRPLREAGRMDARVLETYGDPPRGDLWMRSTDERRPKRVVGDAQFRTLLLPTSLKKQVFRYAEAQGVSVSSLVDKALARLALRGRRLADEETAVLAVTVSTKKWQRALDRANADAFVLAEALREELQYEVRRRK